MSIFHCVTIFIGWACTWSTADSTPPPQFFPSMSPTMNSSCPAGFSFNLETLNCEVCSIGRYSGANSQTCKLCPAGTYSIDATGAAGCDSCAIGKVSSQERTHCTDCSPGQHTWNGTSCMDCEIGRYAPTAQSDMCLECEAGSQTNSASNATDCSSCDAGRFSTGAAYLCSVCPSGTFSTTGSQSCKACNAGEYSDSPGSSSCTSCAAGRYQASQNGSSCAKCPPGRFQSATRMAACELCSRGSYAQRAGSLVCTLCESTLDSMTGASECMLAEEKYYLNPKTNNLQANAGNANSSNIVSFACPTGAVCAGGEEMPKPKVGYWVDRSRYSYADSLYECPRDTCVGTDLTHNINWSCWVEAAYNNDDDDRANYRRLCNVNTLQCRTGSQGILCGSCMDGYTFNSVQGHCERCSDALSIAPLIMIGFLALLAAAVIFARIRGHQVLLTRAMSWPPFNILKHLDSGMAKVVVSTLQILATISWNLSLRFPAPFSSLLFVLGFLKLDFLTLECATGSSSFMTRVYITSVAPLLMALVIAIAVPIRRTILMLRQTRATVGGGFLFQRRLVRSASSVEASVHSLTKEHYHLTKRIVSQHTFALLLLTYIVLPPVSATLFEALDCDILVHSGASFLRADTSIDCNSSNYATFRVIVCLFLLLYQSLPIGWYVLLRQHRQFLNPPYWTERSTVDDVQEARLADPSLALTAFLWADYTPRFWYYECLEMYRRITYIGLIPLVGTGSLRACFGCFVSIVFAVYTREAIPFLRGTTNVLLVVAQYQILATYLAALALETEALSIIGLSDTALGVLLLVLNLSVVALSLFWCSQRYLKDQEHRHWRQAVSPDQARIMMNIMGESIYESSFSVGSSSSIISTKSLEDTIDTTVSSAKVGNIHRVQNVELSSAGDPEVEMVDLKNKNQHKPRYQKSAAERLKQYLIRPKDVVLIRKIGQGSFGEVFKGTVAGGEPVAIKIMLDINEDTARAFRSEILLTASLRHSAIVNFVGACWGGELTCLLLEWVPKGTLQDLLDTRVLELSWGDPLLRLATDMARAMAYLHDHSFYDETTHHKTRGVVHRDLKPENCLITDFLGAKITDFGTSRMMKAGEEVLQTAVGTPLYAAPEIFNGENYDESVDVYSYGLILLAMMIDGDLLEFIRERYRVAFDKKRAPKQAMRLVRAMCVDSWRPVTSYNAECLYDSSTVSIAHAPSSMVKLAIMCCAHDPTQRPSFHSILNEWLGDRCKSQIDGVATITDDGLHAKIGVAFSRKSRHENVASSSSVLLPTVQDDLDSLIAEDAATTKRNENVSN